MFRSRWLVGLALSSLVVLVGCNKGPALSQAGPASEFTLKLSAPEQYRGNAALSMRFSSPSDEEFRVSAIPSDVERIDVALFPAGGDTAVTLPVPIPPPAPASMPLQPAPGEPVMAPDSAKTTVYVYQRNSQHPTPEMPVPEFRDGSVGKPLVGPDYAPPNAIMKASLSKAQLEIGQGEIVFNSLKPGPYGVTMTVYGTEGQVIGQSYQSTQVIEGKTTSLDASSVISWQFGNGNSVNSAVIVMQGPSPSAGVIEGRVGEAVASASHEYIEGVITERMKRAFSR